MYLSPSPSLVDCAACGTHSDGHWVECTACKKWLHFHCAGIVQVPAGGWFCSSCTGCVFMNTVTEVMEMNTYKYLLCKIIPILGSSTSGVRWHQKRPLNSTESLCRTSVGLSSYLDSADPRAQVQCFNYLLCIDLPTKANYFSGVLRAHKHPIIDVVNTHNYCSCHHKHKGLEVPSASCGVINR